MATSFYSLKNNAKTTITNNPLSAGGLSITLASSTGSRFPTTGNTWLATIWDAVTYADPSDDPNMEVVKIDSRSTDTLTVNASGRGFAGTTGVAHATGSAIRLLVMKEHVDQITTAVTTLEGASVGTYTAWTTWAPTITSYAGSLSASSAVLARYCQIGKTVTVEIYITATTVGNVVGLSFTPPVTPSTTTARYVAGAGSGLSQLGAPLPLTLHYNWTGATASTFTFQLSGQTVLTAGNWEVGTTFSYEVA